MGHWLKALAAHLAAARRQAIAGRTINALPHNLFATASQLIIDMVHAYYNADPYRALFSASNNLALPTEMFRSLGGFDEAFRVSEDRDLIDRWLRHGHRLIYAPDVLVYHAPALTGRSFWWQHFYYGRGAFHYHRARARRGSGPFRPDVKFLLACAAFFAPDVGAEAQTACLVPGTIVGGVAAGKYHRVYMGEY